MKHYPTFFALCASLLGAGSAFAHVVLEQPSAAPATNYRATFRVGHGCDGSATTGITVQIPSGFQGAKPMPKAGWALRTTVAALAQPYESHGKTIVQDVVEVSWTATSKDSALPDAWYDEFVLRGYTPHSPQTLWFKVLQTCEKGQKDWSQIPASGTSIHGLSSPAAPLEIIGAGAATPHHH